MEKSPKGIVNLGNTCYINACIQIFSHISKFTDIIENTKISNLTCVECMLWKNINEIVSIMKNGNSKEIIHPNGLIRSIDQVSKHNKQSFLSNHEPEDIGEFILFFLESLHKCVLREIDITIAGNAENSLDDLAIEVYKKTKESVEKNYSELYMLFYGTQLSQITSLDGKTVHSLNVEGFYILDLPIPNNISSDSTIYDCIDKYITPEILDGDNKWLNEKTNKLESVRKFFSFWSFPDVLIISLKRIDFMGNKNSINIQYPLELDLRKYVVGYKKEDNIYHLVGICCHLGNHSKGHYISFVKKEEQWYFCNDETIQNVDDIKHLQSGFAYCLFYTKKNNTI
jgi:ubiquitin C-terminal hydrolase